MASLKAKVLYSFNAQSAGELTIHEGEIVTITNQNVGEGWWEVCNQRGHTGLVPETYCEICGPPEPKIPLPPTPTAVVNTQLQFPKSQSHDAIRQSGMMPGGGNPNGDYMHMGGVPLRKPQQQTTAPPPSTRGGPPPYKAANADDDDFDDDDDWDDDDDDSYTRASTAQSHVGGRASSSVDVSSVGGGDRDSKYNTVSKKSFRFSQFAKAGAELFIFGSAAEESLPSGTMRVTLVDTPNGPRWNSVGQPFVCPISQPHKANKFHGIKSFIAYKITPSFSGIVVTRRYKQFDWLHERLTAKFPMMAIPSLPDKQISGRFEDDFVQERMRWLQLWIDRLCQHPIVAHSDVFQHFLTCTEAKAWKTGKRASEKDNYQAFKFFATVQPLGRIQDAVQVEARMEKYSQFIRSMEASVRNFLVVGDSNRKKHEGPFMKEFHKLGDAFNALAQSFEFDDRPSARNINVALTYTGRAYQDIGQMFTEQPKKDMNTVLEGLWEYKGIIATLPGVVSMHSAAVSKLQENSSKLTPSETTAALRNVDVVASCVMAEMNHVQEHQVADFKNYMRSYLQGQIDFYKQVTSKLEEALASYNNV